MFADSMNNVWNPISQRTTIPAGIARNDGGRGDARGRAASEGGVVLRVAGGSGGSGDWGEREERERERARERERERERERARAS